MVMGAVVEAALVMVRVIMVMATLMVLGMDLVKEAVVAS